MVLEVLLVLQHPGRFSAVSTSTPARAVTSARQQRPSASPAATAVPSAPAERAERVDGGRIAGIDGERAFESGPRGAGIAAPQQDAAEDVVRAGLSRQGQRELLRFVER